MKKPSKMYPILKGLVRLCYPKLQVKGQENLPQEPCVIVANHAQMHGPIACELYFPGKRYTWCAGQMMDSKEVPAYAYQDFWSGKPKWQRPFWKLLSHLITPLCVCVFRNANTIAVYRDARIISTFKNTVKRLQEGNRVVIFPECYEEYNAIVHRFQENFVDIAKLYHKRTGKALQFVPMYIAPSLKSMHLGTPVTFQPDTPVEEERHRICRTLMDIITDMALQLPRHRVTPYPNIPKKQYPYNEVNSYAQTGH